MENTKKRNIFILIVSLQIVGLLLFVLSKQFTVVTGQTIILKTQPKDPVSIMRGNYVRLNYEINSLSRKEIKIVNNATEGIEYGQAIWVTLKKKGKYWEATTISNKKPQLSSGEVAIRGQSREYFGLLQHSTIDIKYGIESYFLPTKKAKEFDRISLRDNSVDVEVKVDVFGNAVISELLINDTPAREYDFD